MPQKITSFEIKNPLFTFTEEEKNQGYGRYTGTTTQIIDKRRQEMKDLINNFKNNGSLIFADGVEPYFS